MNLVQRTVEGVPVIDVSGRITALETPGRLKAIVTDLLAQGHRHIVVNLSQVVFVDSTCLGELVACYVTAARAHGSVKLANAPRRVLELLYVTRLSTVFELHETEAAAIASATGDPA